MGKADSMQAGGEREALRKNQKEMLEAKNGNVTETGFSADRSALRQES